VAKIMPTAAQDAARIRIRRPGALYIELTGSEVRDATAQANARGEKGHEAQDS
jgi:hypothetical protein